MQTIGASEARFRIERVALRPSSLDSYFFAVCPPASRLSPPAGVTRSLCALATVRSLRPDLNEGKFLSLSSRSNACVSTRLFAFSFVRAPRALRTLPRRFSRPLAPIARRSRPTNAPDPKSFFKKGLLFQKGYAIIPLLRKTRPVGQAAKTTPSHGENMGSIPVRVTIQCLNRNT